MNLPAGWQRRYTAASTRLTSLPDILAVSDAIAPAQWASGQALQWVGEPPALEDGARIGVLTGSFNPLTLAHTAVMASAIRSLHLSAVVWACSRVTVDKEHVDRASLVDRLVQLQVYLQTRRRPAGLLVLGAGLYADQAAALRAALPPGARLWLLVGFDKVIQIFDARYYGDRDSALRTLFQAADLAVAPRGELHRADLEDLLALPANRPYARHVRFLSSQPGVAGLSSTAARALAARGAMIPELLRQMEPEGAALARATGAYDPLLTDPFGHAIDRYVVRQALIARLATRPGRAGPERFGHLLERACAPTRHGARLRAAVLGDTTAP